MNTPDLLQGARLAAVAAAAAVRSPRPTLVLRLFGLSLLALALDACTTVGPDYQRPASELPASFGNGGVAATAQEPPAAFWRGFHDPVLDGLIAQALQANQDIRVAMANLQAARAGLTEADAAALPAVAIDGTVNHEVLAQTLLPGSRAARTVSIYNLNLPDARWELDLFGLYARGREQARAQVAAAEAGIQAAQVSLTAELASNYFALRGTQQALAVAQAAVANQEQTLQLVEGLERYGRGTALDTVRARALVDSTRANLPVLESSIVRTLNRIAVLSGQRPDQLQALAGSPQRLPGLATVTSLGTPATLLARRPDVRIAERQLAAANAAIGVATAQLYPHISLNGLLGLNAGSLHGMGQSNAFLYDLGASVVWTPFDFGTLRARIRQNEAQTEAALANYQKTILLALEETEDALVTLRRLQQQVDSLQQAAEHSGQAESLARARFEAGKVDYLTVLDAQRQLLSDQDRLVQAQTSAATALVAVYKALGGGWQTGS